MTCLALVSDLTAWKGNMGGGHHRESHMPPIRITIDISAAGEIDVRDAKGSVLTYRLHPRSHTPREKNNTNTSQKKNKNKTSPNASYCEAHSEE
jgi:hypothetical protein